MPVAGRKLGRLEDDEIYVVDVKSDPEFISMVSQTAGYMPGYHMNKQHWLTVFLDGTVPLEQIFARIDESYQLVTASPSKRIYAAVKQIPKGKVATYGQVAEMAGDKRWHAHPSLDELCSSLDIDREMLQEKLKMIDYVYDAERNTFI